MSRVQRVRPGRLLLFATIFAVLFTAASPAFADRWVADNARAVLYQAPPFKHEELNKEKLGKYNPAKDEQQQGILVANFEDRVILLYEVWTSVKWGEDLKDVLDKAPPELERFTLTQMTSSRVIPETIPCGAFIKKVIAEVKKNTDTPYTGGKRFSWKDPPVIACKNALVLRPRSK